MINQKHRSIKSQKFSKQSWPKCLGVYPPIFFQSTWFWPTHIAIILFLFLLLNFISTFPFIIFFLPFIILFSHSTLLLIFFVNSISILSQFCIKIHYISSLSQMSCSLVFFLFYILYFSLLLMRDVIQQKWQR